MRIQFSGAAQAVCRIFITHGEIETAQALKSKIEQKFNWKCEIPSYLDFATLCEDPQ